jgi:4-hydroxybenzoate polyprenyltransferase
MIRTLLVLGRVSNLPTVWSNCLAAWLLAGGQPQVRLGLVCAGASLLYTGGMFLNDACDVKFDRQYRTERPIPAGQIALRTVLIIALACLLLGWLLIFPLGRKASILAAALIACIVFYDAIHKRTSFAPFLMAACRFLLYLVAAAPLEVFELPLGQAPVPCGFSDLLLWRAGASAGYILGISYLARSESAPIPVRAWPIALLFAPVVLEIKISPTSLIATGWILWCLRGPVTKPRKPLASAVPGLLAGIVLVDWLAVGNGFSATTYVFFALFILALVLQRIAPAT